MKLGDWTCGTCGTTMEVWSFDPPAWQRVLLSTPGRSRIRNVDHDGIPCLGCFPTQPFLRSDDV